MKLAKIRRKKNQLPTAAKFIEQRQLDQKEKLSSVLEENLCLIRSIIGNSMDIVFRKFSFGPQKQDQGAIIWIDGLVDKKLVTENILKPLMVENRRIDVEKAGSAGMAEFIAQNYISGDQLFLTNKLAQLINSILSGDTGIIFAGDDTAIIYKARNWEGRGVDEPDTEAVVRGSREGFVETININTSLLRRRIKSPFLRLEAMKIGRETQTTVVIAYLEGIANQQIVTEVKTRLNKIDTDSILESGYLEQYIEDSPFSIFPTISNSEKPDVVAAKILEGRIAILTDGTPFVLLAPYLFIESFQATEDYYSRPYYASLLRLLRFSAALITAFAPAVYVAVVSFHQETIPSQLLLTVSAAREGVPFPAYMETMIMLFIYEGLREAGIRMPRPIGQAVSIVGALVIGEAAVRAGLVGAPMVIITAITAIFSFLVPSLTDSLSLLRLPFVVLASLVGYFGIIMGVLAVVVHLASLRSLGVPYLSPLAPFNAEMMKDTFIRAPLWSLNKRPSTIRVQDEKRESDNLMPRPDNRNEER